MTNQQISPFGRLRRPAGLVRSNRSYTTAGDTTRMCYLAGVSRAGYYRHWSASRPK
jgi:hypothetical protein